MTATLAHFPPRRASAIFVCPERDGEGWLVVARGHGWLHGSRSDALEDARWLGRNLGFRELGA